MGTDSFTVRTDKKNVKKLDAIASRLDRSRNYIVNEAIENFLEIEAWQIERTLRGIKDADEGRFASDEEMERVFNKYNPENLRNK